MALRLKRVGVTRVRPLAGGFDGWRERSFPVELVAVASVAPSPPLGEAAG